MQEARAALQARATVVCKQRAAEQLALHCSPSVSLSHACGTPSGAAAAAAGNAAVPSPSFNPEQPWQQLFQHRSASGAPKAPSPAPALASALRRSARRTTAGAHQPHGEAMRSHFHAVEGSIGTPPSVEPKLHQARGAAVDRTYSVGSLRRGALSFCSQRQPSGSVCLDGAHSDLSFAPDISAELGGADAVTATLSVDGPCHASGREGSNARERRGAPAPLPTAPMRSRQLSRELSVRGAQAPRHAASRPAQRCAQPHSADANARAAPAHAPQLDLRPVTGAAKSPQHTAQRQSSLAHRCAPPPPIRVVDSPFVTGQADALNRFWISQDGTSPQPPSARGAGGAGSHSPAEGCGSATAAAADGQPPLWFMPHRPLGADAGADAPEGGSMPTQDLPRDGLFTARSAVTANAYASDAARAAHTLSSGAAGAGFGGVGKHGTVLGRRTKGGAMVQGALGPNPAGAAATLALAERATHSHSDAAGGAARAAQARADARAMPAPPARRSRGARIAGLAVNKENCRRENTAHAGVPAPSAHDIAAAVGRSGKGKRGGAIAQLRIGGVRTSTVAGDAARDAPYAGATIHAARSARPAALRSKLTRHMHDSGASQAALSRTELSAGRPELNSALPVCRVVASARDQH